MSKLRDFLKRRAETLARKDRGKPFEPEARQEEELLTDAEFWDILRRMKRESEVSGESHFEALVRILEAYSEAQVEQFVDTYERLVE